MIPKKGRKGFFDGFFDDFDGDFRRMEENITRILEDMKGMPEGAPAEGDPYVYGFSMRVGPDGKPHIEEFGNVGGSIDSQEGEPQAVGGREPLTDLIEGDDEVTVIAELPGIEKEEIDLEIDEESVAIKVDTEQRKYNKELALPCPVNPESSKASYKNGVLEIKLKRQEPKPASEKTKIKID
ncbi:archaeal heat shock protein Hsp20 [Candidatus Altiarchaeota archaeon]